jgi:hypothetical protein
VIETVPRVDTYSIPPTDPNRRNMSAPTLAGAALSKPRAHVAARWTVYSGRTRSSPGGVKLEGWLSGGEWPV